MFNNRLTYGTPCFAGFCFGPGSTGVGESRVALEAVSWEAIDLQRRSVPGL
jgi:hypothetical protein